MSKTIAERVKVCQHCKHFIFKDDMIDFCSSCFHRVEPDIDIEIIDILPKEEKIPTWFGYIFGWLYKE